MPAKKVAAKKGGRIPVSNSPLKNGQSNRYKRGSSASNGYIRIGPQTMELMEHPESILDWDDDELRAGQRKDREGKVNGTAPRVIPRAAYDELMRRTIDESLEIMR